MTFDALVFDLGGVVVAHDDRHLHRTLASRSAFGSSPDQVRTLVDLPEWGTGAAPIADLHARLRRETGYGPGWDTFLADWCCHLAIDASMLGLLRDLRRNERVVIFSNTNKEHWDHLVVASEGLLQEFERYLSYEIGMIKPSVAAFTHVAEAAGIRPSHAIFFDDRLENVEGARRAGFAAEVFRDQASLELLLADKGVRVPKSA